jgi:hypothetical protein
MRPVPENEAVCSASDLGAAKRVLRLADLVERYEEIEANPRPSAAGDPD